MDLSDIELQIGTIFQTYVQMVVLVVGVVGNVLAFVVLTRPFFAKTPVGFYLRALTLADTATIIANINSFVIYGLHITYTSSSQVGCKITIYMFFIPNAVSAWIEALVSFDRMINVIAPARLSFLKTTRFSRLAVLAILVYNLALYSPMLVFFGSKSVVKTLSVANSTDVNATTTAVKYYCDFYSYAYLNILTWYDLFNSILVPCLIMLVCTLVTVRKLYKSRRNISHEVSNAAAISIKNENNRRRVHRDRQFAITSVSLCLVFLALNIGLAVHNIVSTMISVSVLIFDIVFVVYTVNYSIKFYLYLGVNRSFLLEFKNILFALTKRANVSLQATSALSNHGASSRTRKQTSVK